MDVFDLSAKISLDSQQYEQGLKQAGAGATNFGKLFKRVVGGLAIGAAVKKTFDGVISLTKGAIRAYADYEQLVGGMETLYKDNAKDVIANAERAFETAGMSANEYMQTVTSFSSSLLKSVKGDTEKATQYADMAIVDMSDNANKFGTDIESIQNAYRGFAKENYTMLDNLSLGYAGTKTGMKQLLKDAGKIAGKKFKLGNYADMVEAIHVIQENMGIAGTTAEEASKTISGSFNATKASWENLLIAFGSGKGVKKAMRNLVKNATTLVRNTMPVVKNALIGIGQFVEGIAPVIGDALPDLVKEVLPAFLNAGLALGKAIFSSLPGIMSGAWETIKTGINDFSKWLNEKSPELGAAFDAFVQGVTDAYTTIVGLWNNTLWPALQTMWTYITTTLIPNIKAKWDEFAPVVQAAFAAVVNAWNTTLYPALQTLWTFITATLIPAISDKWDGFKESVSAAFTAIVGLWNSTLYPALQSMYTWISGTLSPVFDTLGAAMGGDAEAIDKISSAVKKLLPWVAGVAAAFLAFKTALKVGDTISLVVSGLKSLRDGFTLTKGILQAHPFGIIVSVLAAVAAALVTAYNTNEEFRAKVDAAWKTIKTTATTVFNTIKNKIKAVVAAIKNFKEKAAEIVEPIKTAFEGVRDGIATAIEAVTTLVDGLISKFTTLIDKATEFFGLSGNVSGETPKPKYSDETVTINGVEVNAAELQAAIKEASQKGEGATVEIAGVEMNEEGLNYWLSQLTPVGEQAGEQISSDIGSSLDSVDTSGMESKIGNAGNTAGQQVRSNIQSALSSGSFSINVQANVSGVGGAKIVKEARAMNVGRIFRNPTIFGAAQGALQMAGDAGPEAVVGTNSLTHMIREAVAYGMRSYSASAPSAPVSTQPIVLQVNGKTLGRVMAGDNAAAAAGYNKSIAMGYGG